MPTHNNDIEKSNDPYITLGLESLGKNATFKDIKRAYRKLSMQWHPDKNNNSEKATEQFRKINEAYQILTSIPEPVLSNSKPLTSYFNPPEGKELCLAALKLINSREKSKKLARFFISHKPDILHNLGVYLAHDFVTLDDFRDDKITALHWHVIANMDYFFLYAKMGYLGSVQKYLDNFTNDQAIQDVMKDVQKGYDFEIGNAQFLFLYMFGLVDIFGVGGKSFSDKLKDLKWSMLVNIISKHYVYSASLYKNYEVNKINQMFDVCHAPLHKINKEAILPIKREIELLNKKTPSPENLIKIKQLESAVNELEDKLLEEIPKIIKGNDSVSTIYTEVINVLKPYAQNERIAGYPNAIANIIKVILGSLISIVTCGLATLSNSFLHTFFHNDARYPLCEATNSMIEEKEIALGNKVRPILHANSGIF